MLINVCRGSRWQQIHTAEPQLTHSWVYLGVCPRSVSQSPCLSPVCLSVRCRVPYRNDATHRKQKHFSQSQTGDIADIDASLL